MKVYVLLPFFLLLFCAPALAQVVISDDFNDNSLDSTLWSVTPFYEPWSVAETNQRLEMSGGFVVVTLNTPFMPGSLDVQVDFELLDWIDREGDMVGGLVVTRGIVSESPEEQVADCVVVREDQNYIGATLAGETTIETLDALGRLRITWFGPTVSLYYLSGGTWQLLHQADFPERLNQPVRVSLVMGAEPETPSHGTIAFDNLTVAGEPVPDGYYNNHYYEAVSWPGSWLDARDDAAFARFFGGAVWSCHLATVTSDEENAFILNEYPTEVNGGAFLGGYQCLNVSGSCSDEPDGGWQWVTGESWGYTNWNTGEPNQRSGLPENFLQYYPDTNGNWNDVFNAGWIHSHYIVECEPPEIDVNIKPGSDPNSINTCSQGATPVAIFGSDVLDVTFLDPEAIVLASSQVKTVGKSDRSLCSYEDIGSPDDGFFDNLDPTPDGYLDLVCRFWTYDLALGDVSTEATVTITLEGGRYTLSGSDAVNIVKDCNP